MVKYYSLACVGLLSGLLYATQPDLEEELPRCTPGGLMVEMRQPPPASVSGRDTMGVTKPPNLYKFMYCNTLKIYLQFSN
jgi:hypothetical protein